jgi:uncharacterized protein (DUF302 family)
MNNNGLITIPSVHNVKDTIDLIESDVKSRGLTIFARVDHAPVRRKSACRWHPRFCSYLAMPKAERR